MNEEQLEQKVYSVALAHRVESELTYGHAYWGPFTREQAIKTADEMNKTSAESAIYVPGQVMNTTDKSFAPIEEYIKNLEGQEQ